MDKWFWFLIGLSLIVVGVAAYYDTNNANEFVEKCVAAGGVPSKYHTIAMAGKTTITNTERACLHPSAIINLE